MRKKAFTLIELIAVLVILAILALIVTPLVMNIIKKSKDSANKRSIDAYGRSVELAVSAYLLDNGKFPASIEDLSIEYSGKKVECSITHLNEDSTVYLSDCTVSGKKVQYSYGINKDFNEFDYKMGDLVVYNNIEYYVLEDSKKEDNTLKMIKAEPLSATEIENYYQTLNINNQVTNKNGYGYVSFGQSNSYDDSNIKKIIDAWANDNIISKDKMSVGLLNQNDIIDNNWYELTQKSSTDYYYLESSNTPHFANSYLYWTSYTVQDSNTNVYTICQNKLCSVNSTQEGTYAVRPVVEIKRVKNIELNNKYNIGYSVSYNGVNFYVIAVSGDNSDTVTLLKADPLTTDEVNTYGAGHINKNMDSYYTQTYGYTSDVAVNMNGYGAIFYIENSGGNYDYDHSSVKIVLDNWIADKFDIDELIADNNGYKVKLVTVDDLLGLGCSYNEYNSGSCTNSNYQWIYNSNYQYFTMTQYIRSQYGDRCQAINSVNIRGEISMGYLQYCSGGDLRTLSTVRPVITVRKSVLN